MSGTRNAAIGDRVRIVADEYPEMIGLVGTVTQISNDGTTAWVKLSSSGAWCSRANLGVIAPQAHVVDSHALGEAIRAAVVAWNTLGPRKVDDDVSMFIADWLIENRVYARVKGGAE